MANNKQTYRPPHLLLHDLITALSFWGSTVRLLLMGFLATVSLLVMLSDPTLDGTTEVGMFIYVLATFLVFDVGYVMLARGLKLKPALDRLAVAAGDSLIAIAYVLPTFAVTSGHWTAALIWSPLVVFGVLSLRALLGLLNPSRA